MRSAAIHTVLLRPAWRRPPAPTAQARAGGVPLSLNPRAVALSATARSPRMLARCQADGSSGTAAAQANVTSSSAVGSAGGMGSARAATRQAPDTGSSMWGLAREQLRSLGCCVAIIHHERWTPAHGLSPCHTDCLRVSGRRRGKRTGPVSRHARGRLSCRSQRLQVGAGA